MCRWLLSHPLGRLARWDPSRRYFRSRPAVLSRLAIRLHRLGHLLPGLPDLRLPLSRLVILSNRLGPSRPWRQLRHLVRQRPCPPVAPVAPLAPLVPGAPRPGPVKPLGACDPGRSIGAIGAGSSNRTSCARRARRSVDAIISRGTSRAGHAGSPRIAACTGGARTAARAGRPIGACRSGTAVCSRRSDFPGRPRHSRRTFRTGKSGRARRTGWARRRRPLFVRHRCRQTRIR